MQMPLFDTVSRIYADHPESAISQDDLYQHVAAALCLTEGDISRQKTLRGGGSFNVFKRDCRWIQQRMKAKGLLERVDKGMWKLTRAGKDELTEIQPGYVCLAFSTELGICLWGDSKTVGETIIDRPINLVLTSPPYLGPRRNYGVYTDEKAWVRFIVESLEPYVEKMAPGAGLVLNVGNDMFEAGRPVRSVGIERLVIELHDALGLSLVERICWKANKVPGPTQWAFVRRYMLRAGFEFVFCFTNDPEALQWNNRNVLEEHTDQYLNWCRNGGQKEDWQNNTYRKRKGAFSQTQESSKIPTNVLSMGTTRADMIAVKEYARRHGLPEHTAMFPMAFAEFFIKWMTKPGETVADIFGGTLTVAAAAEKLGRRWVSCDRVLEFLQAGESRFSNAVRNDYLQWPKPV